MARILTVQLQDALVQNGLNITVEQWRLLYYLWQQDGINQRELAKIASKEKSTITRQIDGLVSKGLLTRINNVSDKRNKLLFLTEEGKRIKSISLKTAQVLTEKSESKISEERMEIFMDVLSDMIKNVKE